MVQNLDCEEFRSYIDPHSRRERVRYPSYFDLGKDRNYFSSFGIIHQMNFQKMEWVWDIVVSLIYNKDVLGKFAYEIRGMCRHFYFRVTI